MAAGADETTTLIGMVDTTIHVGCPPEALSMITPLTRGMHGDAAAQPVARIRVRPKGSNQSHLPALHTPPAAKVSGGRWEVFTSGPEVHLGYPSLDIKVLRRFFTAAMVGPLAQRGFHCFHAAAVLNGQQACLLAGPSGSGKSTLSAALADFGAIVWAENFSLVDSRHEIWNFFDPRQTEDRSGPSGVEVTHVVLLTPTRAPRSSATLAATDASALEAVSVTLELGAVFAGITQDSMTHALAWLAKGRSWPVLRLAYDQRFDTPERLARRIVSEIW